MTDSDSRFTRLVLRILREAFFGFAVILCVAPFFTDVDVLWCLVLAAVVAVMSAAIGAMTD